jgi:hypothetical protein
LGLSLLSSFNSDHDDGVSSLLSLFNSDHDDGEEFSLCHSDLMSLEFSDNADESFLIDGNSNPLSCFSHSSYFENNDLEERVDFGDY